MTYTLTPEMADRLIKAMRWVESQRAQGAGGTVEIDATVPNRQLVRVDSDGPVFVFGTVVKFDATSGTLEDLEGCYLAELNSRPLSEDEVYLAYQSGSVSIDDDERPIFVIAQPCCGESPCCDLEIIASACLTFTSIVIDGQPVNSGSPVSITLTQGFTVGLGWYLSGSTTLDNGVSEFLYQPLIRCVGGGVNDAIGGYITDALFVLVFQQLTIVSCDPYSATLGSFSETIDGHTYEFNGPITIVGPGACP